MLSIQVDLNLFWNRFIAGIIRLKRKSCNIRIDINSKDQCHFMTWEYVGGIQGDYYVIMETNQSDPEAN